ncbi:hypothetical protein Clacol_004898 [Clathrus columnatus]|uniref:NACHT domain-containing protein n=1 Tax=Clathrus columnatus TaxID=1419009 RepID=A0AAV5ADV5_9AGAM|nr:hypothetical protein Clacol_004898 [Clathrus columnatus]
MKKLRPIRLDHKKPVPRNKESQVNQESEGSRQPQSGLVKNPGIDRNELGSSIQAASQALKSTYTITGKRLEHEDKPGYYDRVSKSIIQRLSIFSDLVQKFADVHPYAKTSWSIISTVITIITDTQKIDQNILDLFETLDSTYEFIEESTEIQSHPSYQRILSSLAKQTLECAYFIQGYAKKQNFCTDASKFYDNNRIRVGTNIIGEPIRLRVQNYQDSFAQLLAEFQTRSAVHTEISVGRLLELNISMGENLDLSNLSYASGAGLHTRKQCLPGTRIEVLDEIIDWINNDDDNCPRLFWLAGSAGMGKSAIAHSIGSRFKSIKRLGSFFCFDKNSVERRDRIFSTIARDLADLDPQIKHELAKIIKDETSLRHTTDLQLQWEKFISEPLCAISEVSTGPILIVIDGLDESGDPISRQRLLAILEKEIPSLPVNIRFLITSRPEKDILLAFNKSQSHIRSKMMNNIPETETNRDILAYFKTTLKVKIEEESFGDAELKRLVDLSQGLFQWAYLASEFLTALGNGAGSTINERYEDLNSTQHVQSIGDPLDAMYNQILSSLFNLKDPRVMSRFRSVIGSIIATSEPLSQTDLIALRGENISLSGRKRDIKVVLEYMGSLLGGIDDPSSPIRPLHLSFREYLLDHNRSREFCIDPVHCHRDLAFGCLRTMMGELRFNICDIPNSHIRNVDDKGLSERVSSSISSQLSYSCRYWGQHVSSMAFDPLVAGKVEKFLHHGFLLWLEALSLLQAISGAAKSLSGLISWCSRKESHQTLCNFAVDGKRFIQLFGGAIADSAPHVYLSALPFSPQESIIYKHFISQFPNTLRIASEPIHDWPLGWRRTSIRNVEYMSFSHGGQYFAVAKPYEGIVRVLDPETLGTLWTVVPSDEDGDCIRAVQFSTGDKSLVFSAIQNIYSYDILTGALTILHTHSDFSFSDHVIISQDARFVAFRYNLGAESKLIVWNLGTREEVINIHVRGERALYYGFSNTDNGSFITYLGMNIGVQIWDLQTGALLQLFPIRLQLPDSFDEPDLELDQSFMLTLNGKYIVFHNYHRSYLWNYRDNSLITVEGKYLDITPDGDSVIIHRDNSILLRDKNGCELPCPTTNTICANVLSKDGNRLAISDDEHLDILDLDGWQSYARRDIHSSKSTTSPWSSIDVSLDGKYFLAISAETGYYEIWDVRLGQPIRKFPGSAKSLKYYGPTSSRVFSPMSRYLGYVSDEQTVNLYNVDSGIMKDFPFGDRKVDVESIAFSQDETLMATLDLSQGTIHTWDIGSSQIVDTLTIPSHPKPQNPPKFKVSPTLRYFAYALNWNESISISLFNHSRPISLHHLTGTSNWEDFTFSADEEYMIISRESKIFHFNLITEKCRAITLQEIPKHLGPCKRFIFFMSNSDIRLFEYNYWIEREHVGYVWDASSGQLLHSVLVNYPDDSIKGFIPSYQYLLTSTSSCTRVFNIDPKEDWIRFSSTEQHSLQTLPRGSSVTLRPDGWVITQNDELLFWVPQDYHERLHIPSLKYIIGMKATELDLSSFSHGRSWTSCIHRDGSNPNF